MSEPRQEPRDTKKGWDLLIRIMDPITGGIFLDNVPVQCKNYSGNVDNDRPIEDRRRSVRDKESNFRVTYLFILGDLTEDFRRRVERVQQGLSKLEALVEFVVVDQAIIANLYIRVFGAGDLDGSD